MLSQRLLVKRKGKEWRGESMLTILFDSYRKYQKDNKDNGIRSIFKLPMGAKILLGGLFLCLIYSVLTLFIDSLRSVYFICLLLEFALCICLYFYTENYQIKNSDIRFSVYQDYCWKINQWLIQIGIVVTKENVTELVRRLENEIEQQEKQRTLRRERIEKWIQIIIIPILLAVFSAIISEQTDLTSLLSYAIAFLVTLSSIALIVLVFYNGFDFFRKRKLEQLKSLSSDLQGVLDCQFDDKLFLNSPKSEEDKK